MKPKTRLRKALATPALELTFKCPHCKMRVMVRVTDPPVILHDMPTCVRYDRVVTVRDGADYLKEAREKEESQALN